VSHSVNIILRLGMISKGPKIVFSVKVSASATMETSLQLVASIPFGIQATILCTLKVYIL
jgi:hypothetical protein